MPELVINDVVAQLLAVLREAFEGPPEDWSYFTDHGSEAGLFGTLGKLTAPDASRPIAGTTVAAHAGHVRFSLAAASAWIRGDRSRLDWHESWRVRAVDDEEWRRLQEELRKGYRDLRKAIETDAASGVESVGGAIGATAHFAYHLGPIRPKVAASRA